MLSDRVDQYELAEQVFKYRLERVDRRVPFTAWKSSFSTLEDWDSRVKRNNAVANVFGSESLEMREPAFFTVPEIDI